MTVRHKETARESLVPARTVTRRDALRLLAGAGASLVAAPLRALAENEAAREAEDQGFDATEETNAALADAQARLDEVTAELDRIGQEYADMAAQHSRTLDEIERVTKEIAALEEEIELKQLEIERKQTRLGNRMSSAYKSGNQGVLDLLFSAATFDEFTSNVYYLDKITENDRMMIEDIKTAKEELEADKAALEEQQAQLEILKQQEEDELERIRDKQAEVQELLNSIDDEVRDLLEKRDAEILAAKEAWEEEERRRREEEERRAAAAAAAAAEGGGVYGEVSYESGSSGSQDAIVSAASWTPSTGAGYCAAWVSNVFANAGVGHIYGNACDMYWAYCYSSDLSEISTGMIIAVPTEPYSYAAILYGHVGIYIGNGMVRHCVSGVVTTQSLSSWISQFGVTSTPRWGWLGGIVLG